MGELGRTIQRYLGRARTRVPATLLAVAALLASTLVLSAAPPAHAIGPCSVNWIGASGAWEDAANWRDVSTLQNRVPVPADVACISDGLPETTLVITMTGTKTIAGIDNTEELRTASTITLSDGGEIVNGGLFVLSSGADIVGTSAGTGVERVTNYGTLRVAAGGTSTQIFNTVVVDSLGQVDVQSGQLFVDQVGNWREPSPSVATGSTLTLTMNAASDPWGNWSMSGGGVVRITGVVQPKTSVMALSFAADRLDWQASIDASQQPIINTGVLGLGTVTILGDAHTTSAGFINAAAGEVRQTGDITLTAGSAVRNEGLWTLASTADVVGTTSGTETERFINTGTIRSIATGNNAVVFHPTVTVDSYGQVEVVDNSTMYIDRAGIWREESPTLSIASSRLQLAMDTTSDPSGTWSVTGDGLLTINGTIQPKTTALYLNFAAGRVNLPATIDASQQPIINTGVLGLGTVTILGDAHTTSAGFINAAAGEVRQTGDITLTAGSAVRNEGLWTLASTADVVGTTSGTETERFINTGTIRSIATGNNAVVFHPTVTVDSYGQVEVVDNSTMYIDRAGIWREESPTLSIASSRLQLAMDTTSDPSGTWSVTGDGLLTINGTIQPKTTALYLNFAAGRVNLPATIDASQQPIINTGVLGLGTVTIIGDAYTSGAGFINAASGEVRQTGDITLTAGSAVRNEGLWTLASTADVVGTTSGTETERFINTGTIRSIATGNNAVVFHPTVTVDSYGQVEVVDNSTMYIDRAGIWREESPTLSIASSRLQLAMDTTSDPSGTWSVTGDGLLTINGTIQPKTTALYLNFAAGRVNLPATIDASQQPIINTGVLGLGTVTILGDAHTTSAGFINAAAGEVRQTGDITLTAGSAVRNEGLWTLASTADVVGTTSGTETERFINTGTIRSIATGNNAVVFHPTVTVDSPGTVDVLAGGHLYIDAPLPQIAGTGITAGTWRTAGTLHLQAAPTLTTIGSGASVELAGTGTVPKLSGLTTVDGSFRLTGGKDHTTGALTNSGVVAVGPASRLTVNGAFSTTGEVRADIAGPPAGGQFGDVVASGVITLGGRATVVRDAGYSPAPDDLFTIVRGSDRTAEFGVVDAPGFVPTYTPTAFQLNGTGSVPTAAAGADVDVTESTPPGAIVLDGSGSTDVDGTIVSYRWTASDGVVLTGADTAQAGVTAADDLSFLATLEVCDDHGLCDTDSVSVLVRNAAPVATAPTTASVETRTVFTLNVGVTDAGGLDTHTATVAWGDGAIDSAPVIGGAITATHTYAATGVRTAAVCVTDDDGSRGCASTEVTATGNDGPIAVDDAATTTEDTPVDIDVLVNDTDAATANGDLVVAAVRNGVHGTTTIVGRQVHYTPAADRCGTDTFTYDVSDGELTATAFVSVETTCVPDAPVANAGGDRSLQEGSSQTLFASRSDADGDTPLTASWTPATGLEDASLLQPTVLAADDSTTDYTLSVCDPTGLCGTDTVNVTVANLAPSVFTTVARVAPTTPTGVALTFTDAGALDTHTATVDWGDGAGPVALGTVTSPLTLPSRGFAPGATTGTVCITDDDGGATCAQQVVIARSDVAPDAVDDAFTVAAASTDNAFPVLANDTDADGDPFTITSTGQPSAGGSLACTSNSCTYSPAAGFDGTETFTYTVDDETNGTDTATVTVTVTAPNQAPTATLGITPDEGVAPHVVTALVGGSDPNASDVLDGTLDWGDGSPAVAVAFPVGSAPTHTYSIAGTYVVRLAVSDGETNDVVTAVVRVGAGEPLSAAAGDDQVVSLGAAIRLNATGSRPTVGIGSYRWVIRDGAGTTVAIRIGSLVEWTPDAAGTYVAELTVTLGAEVDVDTARITVVDPVVEPGLAVTVRGGGDLLQGADVLALDADGVRFAGVTGADGTTRLLGLPDGEVAVYAFAPGFVPTVARATVTDGSGAVSFALAAGQVAQTSLESRRLTIAEIIDLGIDPNDPANQHVFEFEIHLAFTPEEPVTFTGVTTNGGAIIGGEYGGGGGGGSFGAGTGIEVGGGYTVYPTVRSVGGQPVIIWLVIPGEARWLKEFFEVKMLVSNLAPAPFTFEGGTASLDALPEGLTLAPTAVAQEAVQSLPDIPAGGSAAATWIVRGDTAGDYELAATYAASLEPIGAPISMVARTAPGSLRVWGGDALTMRVLAEERLLDGHPYRVVVEMTNVSDIPVYNLAVELKEEGKLNYIYQPREELTRSVAELAPGETLRADYVLVPTVGIYTPLVLLEEISFVKKTGGDVEVATEIVSVPPRYADADRPAISLRREGSDVVITWAAVPGATRYQLFTTTAPEIAFDATPIATLPAGTTTARLPLTAALAGKHLAVSPTVAGRPDMVHRRVAVLGGSYLTPAETPSSVERVVLVGDGLVAGIAGTDACGRSGEGFGPLVAGALGASGADLGNVACAGAASGNVAFAAAGPSLDDEYVTGAQAPLASTTQADAVAQFAAAGGAPDVVLVSFGAEDLGLTGILGQCGWGCDTRWRATAQAVLRDRVYPRVYENLRALELAHPSAVVVAFAPPTPVAAGSSCALFGTNGGITAAESRFLANELYPWLQTTLRRAAINAGVNMVDVTTALEGHQACDPEPWVAGVVTDGDGAVSSASFQPTAAGHAAIADALLGVVVDGAGDLLLANPTATVLRVLAPQEEAPFVVPVTARQVDACTATCPVRITVPRLRSGDRIDVLVAGAAPQPSSAAAGPDGTVDVTVQVPAPGAPTPVVVEVSSIDRNLTGSTVATIGVVVDLPPVATPDAAATDEDVARSMDVLLNDIDPDGGILTVAVTTAPDAGTATVEDDVALGRQVVRYTPAPDRCGEDTFGYTITDPTGLTASAVVTVAVACVNDAPVVTTGAPVTVAEGATAPLAANVTDADSTAFTWSWTPAGGLDAPGSATPTFTATDDGSPSFAATVCDDGTPQACTTLADAVDVTVTNVAPTVVAAADTTAQAGVALTLPSIATYADAGTADTHTATIAWGDGAVSPATPASGGLVAGSHTYAVAGPYVASICVTDDDGGTTCDTIGITVQPAGPRVSIGDVTVTEADGSVTIQVPVSLSMAPTRTVAVRVETVDGTATAGPDYTARVASVSFTPTGARSQNVPISVRGDLLAEPDETFAIRIVPPVTAPVGVADGEGIVTIVNDDECTIVGTTGADVLTGTAGADVICGLAGDDVIDGGGGDDDLRGESGTDVVSYASAPSGVTVSIADGTATDRGTQRLTGLEYVVGSEHDDTITGGPGNDVLVGGGGADTITGGLGVDELDGGAGNDRLLGGDGSDDLLGGDGADELLGELGNDHLDAEGGDDVVSGGDGVDVLRGGAGADTMTGGLANDRIDGQADDDEIDGGDGSDVLVGGAGVDTIGGGTGNDDLAGGTGSDTLDGGDGNDTLQGDEDGDSLSGGLGDDVLRGDDGDDMIVGGVGRDRLDGGAGVNALDGGEGLDTCRRGTASACERP